MTKRDFFLLSSSSHERNAFKMSPLVGTHIKKNTHFSSPGWTLSGPRYNMENVPTPPTADPAGILMLVNIL